MTDDPNSLVDILRWRAIHEPYRLAYRYLKDGETDEVTVTYKELDRLARAIAANLQSSSKLGDRAILLFPPGLDFVAAYFAGLYAGVIVIPAYPPHPARLEKTLETTLRIIVDAEPTAILLTASLLEAINSQSNIKKKFDKIKLLVTDTDVIFDGDKKWQQPEIDKDDIAFLQYTSGSTSAPKGVMISHGNLLNNLERIEKSMGLTSQSSTVFWLPPYHDMGLIGGVLQSLYTGYPVTLIPHLMFLQKPIRWLKAISRYKATTSGAPNFAYDLCVRKIKTEQIKELDLSRWEVAFNGAEPVHRKTMDQFSNHFFSCGYKREAFFPCYGLAESTLMVTGGPKSRIPKMKTLLKSGLQENKAILAKGDEDDTQTIISSGQSVGKQKMIIVDVETHSPCPPDCIGEVWISSSCVGKGYWNRPAESESTFNVCLSGTTEESYLRTGDLGFIAEEELYITGRLKNLIIVNGKNHYPHDIQRTVEDSHLAIISAGCAVFSVENTNSEQVIVVAEIQHKQVTNPDELTNTIRRIVSQEHGVSVSDIKLVLQGSIPKTTSGKIKHFLCKKNYLTKTLKEITLL
jgi:acyl-CoA synthetase (AMP-forming)/AMP-acid ligase II